MSGTRTITMTLTLDDLHRLDNALEGEILVIEANGDDASQEKALIERVQAELLRCACLLEGEQNHG